MTQKIVFKIAKDGALTIEADGFKGQSCLEKSQAYMQGLGITTSQEHTPEFFEEAGVQITVGR